MVAGVQVGPQALAESFRSDILAGKLKVGARLPTEAELVAQSGLSRPAVREVYDRLAQEGLIIRLRRSGTFVRSNTPVQHSAKGLSLLFLLGLQLGDPLLDRNRYWPGRPLVGLERGAHSHNDNWIYATENRNAAPGELIPQSVDMNAVDGVISYVLPNEAERRNMAGYLEVMGKPHVALNEYFTEHGTNCVVDDCTAGMGALVARAAELGHLDTVFCGAETPYTVYPTRLNAYREAILAANLPYYAPISVHSEGSSDESVESLGIVAGQRVLQMRRRPTAVFCSSDRLALGLMEFLQSKELKVPEQISVIGYDGNPKAELSQPGLTTVNQDLAAIGEEAVHCVHRMIENRKYRGAEVRIVPTPVFRGSLGPAASATIRAVGGA